MSSVGSELRRPCTCCPVLSSPRRRRGSRLSLGGMCAELPGRSQRARSPEEAPRESLMRVCKQGREEGLLNMVTPSLPTLTAPAQARFSFQSDSLLSCLHSSCSLCLLPWAPNICLSLTPPFSGFFSSRTHRLPPTRNQRLSVCSSTSVWVSGLPVLENPSGCLEEGQGHSGVRKPRTLLLQQYSEASCHGGQVLTALEWVKHNSSSGHFCDLSVSVSLFGESQRQRGEGSPHLPQEGKLD